MTEDMTLPPALPNAATPPASPYSAERLIAGLPGEGHEAQLHDLQQRFKALELQLALEQQRHCDRVEEELQKLQQLLAAAVREQQQQQHGVSAMVRETIEHFRKEFADALQHLSHDFAQTLRQAEVHTRHALDSLRDEMLSLLHARDQASARPERYGELRVPQSPPFAAPEESQE
jgi:hypothetical protein